MKADRHFDRSALAALVPVVAVIPAWLVTMMLTWLIIRSVFSIPWWSLPLGWLAGSVLLFVPLMQTAVLAPVLGARRPTREESNIIAPLWSTVALAAGLSPTAYHLRIIDADDLNAYACGGHLVLVTTFAIEELDDDELAGVLAHEISHLIGFHTVALTIGHWLSIPIVVLARLGFRLQITAQAATDVFARKSAVGTLFGRFLALCLQAMAWLLFGSLVVADWLQNLVGHRSEIEADERAVALGFGPELRAALRAIIMRGGGQRSVGWRGRIATSHPPARTRVQRIEAQLRRRSNVTRRR